MTIKTQQEDWQIEWTHEHMRQARTAHLGFIQGVINRMGLNSFLAKGWTVTMTAAIFALSDRDNDQRFILIALFPVAVFWALDAYYLHQEKLYRKLYKKVAKGDVPSDKFTLDAKGLAKDKDFPNVIQVFLSQTLLVFYGTMVGSVLFVMFALLRR